MALASAFLLAGLASAAATDRVLVLGELTYGNFPRLEAWLRKANGKPVNLDISMAVEHEKAEGNLTTFMVDDKFEISYLQPGQPARIYSNSGELDDSQKTYLLQGVFTVEADNDTLRLTFFDGPPIGMANTIEINDLPAATGN